VIGRRVVSGSVLFPTDEFSDLDPSIERCRCRDHELVPARLKESSRAGKIVGSSRRRCGDRQGLATSRRQPIQGHSDQRLDFQPRLLPLKVSQNAADVALPKPQIAKRRQCLGENIRLRRQIGRRRLGAFGTFFGNECCAEDFTRGVHVVRLAEQTKVFNGRRSAQRKRLPMLERHEAARRAAPAFGVGESTLSVIALPDLPCDVERNVAGVWLELAGLARLARSRARLLLALDELVERALEHPGDVATRNGVARELPRSFELGAKLRAGGKFYPLTFGRKRLESKRLRPGAEVLSARAGRRVRTRALTRSGRTWAERLDLGGHIGPGKPAREHHFERATRLAARFREELVGVVLRQERSEQNETRQVNRAAPELFESAGKVQGELGHAGPVGGGIFRVFQAFFAVFGERRACLLEIEPPPLDFEKMLDDLGDGFLLGAHQKRQTGE
jgi:hypothetical protein